MKKRRIKKNFTTQELLAQLLRGKPQNGEEDFWVFSICYDDPRFPTYEERVTTLGTHEQCARQCAMIIETLVRTELPKGLRIESYQGEEARHFMANVGKQERRYRQEIEAQSSN